MKCFKYYIIVLFLTFGTLLSGQELLVGLSPLLDAEELELSEDKFDKIIDASKDVMKKYYKRASIYDKNIGLVNEESIDNFRSLFTSNAKVVNDLYEQLMTGRKIDNYVSDALDHLQKEGVEFSMFSASVRDVSYDKAGFYKVQVQTQKTLYNGINSDNSVMKCKSGRVYFLIFTLFIQKEDLSIAKIHNIKGEIKKRCEDASPSFGIHLKTGIDVTGGAGFNNNKSPVPAPAVYQGADTDFAVNVENFKVFGLGAALNYPITTKDLLFFSVQLNYELYRINSTARGTYYFVDENSQNQVVFDSNVTGLDYEYQKYVSMNVSESASFHRIELPVGLMYKKKFKKNNRISVGAYAWLVTGFNLFQNIESSIKDLQYWANIDFANKDLGINFQDDSDYTPLESFGIGAVSDFSSNAVKAEVQTSFSFRISPYVHITLNDEKNSYLEIGLEFTRGLNSPINHDAQSELFLRDVGDDLQNIETELEASLLGGYFQKSSATTLGLRIGYLKNFGN